MHRSDLNGPESHLGAAISPIEFGSKTGVNQSIFPLMGPEHPGALPTDLTCDLPAQVYPNGGISFEWVGHCCDYGVFFSLGNCSKYACRGTDVGKVDTGVGRAESGDCSDDYSLWHFAGIVMKSKK